MILWVRVSFEDAENEAARDFKSLRGCIEGRIEEVEA